MPNLIRVAAAAAASLCVALLGVSSPSEAQQLPGGGIATMMLAVATPLSSVQTVLPDLGTPMAGVEAAATPDAPSATTLAALVAEHETSDTTGDEHECLANAVYFESRGEPLEGQLAVAQVILNRVASGRYAATVCGVVNQPGQFSFNRRKSPPDNRDWRTAKAIAAIAATAQWEAMAPRATAFHAARVSAGWSMTKVAAIGNHVFYR